MSIERDVTDAVELAEIAGEAKDRIVAAVLCATWAAAYYKHLLASDVPLPVALNLTMQANYQMIENTLNSACCGQAHESDQEG